MKSATVLVSSRAHCWAVVTVGCWLAAGFGTVVAVVVAFARGTVLPSWWHR